MPSTEIVEKIHEQLIPLGDEPAVAAERGEIVEPPPRPSQDLDDDLSALLADTDVESEAISQQQQRDSEEPGEEDSTELLSRLDSLFDDEEASGEPTVEDALSGLDLGDEDFPAPADFSFDPDAVPDELPGDFDESLTDEPISARAPDEMSAPDDVSAIGDSDELDEPLGEEDRTEEPTIEAPSGPLSGDADDALASLEGTDDDILAAFGEDIDADPLADLAALSDEADRNDAGDSAASGVDFDTGDLDGTADSGDDDLFGLEDATIEGADEPEDFGDVLGGDIDGIDESVGGGVSDSDFDVGDLDAAGETGEFDESSDHGISDPDLDIDAFGEPSDADRDLGGDDGSAEDDASLGALDGPDEFGDFPADDFGGPDEELSEFDIDSLGETEEAGDVDLSATDDAALDGLDGLEEFGDVSGVDIGESDELPGEELSDSDFDIGGLDDFAVSGDDSAGEDTDDTGEDRSSDDDAAFEDLGEVDDNSLSDSFGSDFGSQMDEDFGDVELDEDASTGAAFSDADDVDFSSDDDSLDDLDALDEDGFSLGDFGEEFDIREDSIDEFAGLDFETEGIEEEGEAEEEALHGPAGEIDRELSDEEFLRLRKTLSSLPLNIKIATEECIGEGKGSAESINELIDLLIGGASPVKIADHVSKTIGKKLEVPRGYQKRSGLAFEEEQQTLLYRFQHVVLPMLRTALLIGLATAVVGLLGHRFVYRPIHAAILYQRGYEYALEDRYQLANDTFFRAWQLRPRDRWFTEYAELYVEKRQYQLAVEKYDELVFGMDEATREFLRRAVSERRLIESVPVGPRERRQIYDLLNVNREAILDHGALQSEVLASYERADELYSIVLFGDEYDYDALLARGDNFMRWADENPERYEDARLAYAGLLARYGDTDEILMRFLRYFVRTDNAERVEELVDLFEEQAPQAEVDPEIYAGAAGYMMDRGRVTGIREMLIRSYQRDPLVPEVHYELARYSRVVQAPIQEREALENARQAFALAEPLSPRRLMQQIDTDIRSGEYWYERDEFLQARGDFDAARRRYETARESGFISAEAHLARLYARLADLEYFQGGDLEYALDRYNRASAEGYETDELNYKRGFIHFVAGRFDQAVDRFYDIGSSNALVGPDTVLYARANTLFLRENFFGAEAFYRELLDRLDAQRDAIPTLLVEENPAHRAVVENLIRVNNNLGVTLFQISERDVTQEERLSEGLSLLTESAELSENYLREDETGERAAATNLAFLNIRDILYPAGDFEPRIYEQLPRDIAQELF